MNREVLPERIQKIHKIFTPTFSAVKHLQFTLVLVSKIPYSMQQPLMFY